LGLPCTDFRSFIFALANFPVFYPHRTRFFRIELMTPSLFELGRSGIVKKQVVVPE
jgi:hypothetical protein